MKRLILILLAGILCISVFTTVSAKVSFGGWDRWGEELPPAEHKYWYWAVASNSPRIFILRGYGEGSSDVTPLFSDTYFYGDKKGKTKASVLFYSSGDVDKKDWDIPNADLALVAFPPKKGKMIIRAYKMEKMENKVFKFFDQWEITFKDNEVVVPEPEGMEFKEIFKEWLKKQISSEIVPSEDIINFFLPKLKIWQKSFQLVNCQLEKK